MEKDCHVDVEYAIQKKTPIDTSWIYYSREKFGSIDNAVKMLDFFRKSSNGAEFRLVKQTHITSIEPV